MYMHMHNKQARLDHVFPVCAGKDRQSENSKNYRIAINIGQHWLASQLATADQDIHILQSFPHEFEARLADSVRLVGVLPWKGGLVAATRPTHHNPTVATVVLQRREE